MSSQQQTRQASNITPLPKITGKSLAEPQSEPAEEALVACVLSNQYLFHPIASALCDGRDAFFFLRHSYIWDAMTELSEAGTAIDIVTLSEKMLENNTLIDVGGPAYFTQLIRNLPTSSNYSYYLEIVNATYKRREMLKTADELTRAAMDTSVNANSAINTAYSHLDKLNDKGRTFTTIGDGLLVHMDNAEKALNNPNKMGVPSGITKLDEMIDGFHKTRVYVIAARTTHGKTSLMLSVTLNAAKLGSRIGIFNVADGNSQDVISRIVGMESETKGHNIVTGRLSPEEYSHYVESASKVSKLPIYIESKKGMTLPELLISARNMQYRYGLDLVCIDYIQRIGIDTSKKGAPLIRLAQLEYISTAITVLAGEAGLNIPILIGAQMNRGAVGRAPVMSDIQGCGGIEQDSDVVIMPYRESMTADSLDLIVDKNRVNGQLGVIDVKFNRETTLISDLEW